MHYINIDNEEISRKIKSMNMLLQNLVIMYAKNNSDLDKILSTLNKNFEKGKVKTREIVIEWFSMLFKQQSENLIGTDEAILKSVYESINFKDSKLIESVLLLLCNMAGEYNRFLNKVIRTLLNKLENEKGVQIEYINKIIDIMCSQIEPKVVFSEFAIEIRKFKDCMFVGFMVETLDLILAGSDTYKQLRDILARSDEDEEKQDDLVTLLTGKEHQI